MKSTRFINANVIDTRNGKVLANQQVRVQEGRIVAVSDSPLDGDDDQVVDVRGQPHDDVQQLLDLGEGVSAHGDHVLQVQRVLGHGGDDLGDHGDHVHQLVQNCGGR